MATPHQPDDPGAGPSPTVRTQPPPADGEVDAEKPVDADKPADYDREAPRVIRLRLSVWDLACTVALLILLVVLATATNWPGRLFGFLAHVCEGEDCGPVPFGVDFYIYPVVWGGIGAAVAAAVLGPVVSLLKGWYMSFWPVLSLALLMVSSIAGFMLTTFSQRYWL